MKRGLLSAAVLALIGNAAPAQSADGAGRAIEAECGSVVIVKCEKRNQVQSPGSATERARKSGQSGRIEVSRSGDVLDLGTVVIEGDRLRPPSVAQAFQGLAPVGRRAGTHTFHTGEGTQCSCMNLCPPWWTLMPCCSCSSHEGSRLSVAPGSSPLR